ncbi:UNVERIFIED_CONTAM: hypothetical protein FKN15_013337 [Acipenser sinensis]
MGLTSRNQGIIESARHKTGALNKSTDREQRNPTELHRIQHKTLRPSRRGAVSPASTRGQQ